MSESTSLPVAATIHGVDAAAATARSGPAKPAGTRTEAETASHSASFLDFLNAFNSLSGLHQAASQAPAGSGNALPLAVQAAVTGRPLSAVTNPQQAAMSTLATASQTPSAASMLTPANGIDATGLQAGAHPLAASASATTNPVPPVLNPQSESVSKTLASRLAAMHTPAAGGDAATPGRQPTPLLQQAVPVEQQSNPALLSTSAAMRPADNGMPAAALNLAGAVDKQMLQDAAIQGAASASSKTGFKSSPGSEGGRSLASLHATGPSLPDSLVSTTANLKQMMFEQALMLAEKQTPQLSSSLVASHHDIDVNAALPRLVPTQAPALADTATGSSQPITINETFGKPEWNQGMARQVLWMANQSISSAELRLNPAHLGPIEVRIDMEDDQVSLTFSSRHAVVREAVEQAIPRLREMFEDSGLKLADADVSQQSFAEQNHDQAQASEQQQHAYAGRSAAVTSDAVEPGQATVYASDSMVDYYI